MSPATLDLIPERLKNEKVHPGGVGGSRPRELLLTCAGTLGVVTYKDIDFFILRLM